MKLNLPIIYLKLQCPLDIQTLDKAAALPIAAATRVLAKTLLTS